MASTTSSVTTKLVTKLTKLVTNATTNPLEELKAEVENLKGDVDSHWLIYAGTLVFLMQAGFTLLEAGSVSAKNATNILFKNVLVNTFLGLASSKLTPDNRCNCAQCILTMNMKSQYTGRMHQRDFFLLYWLCLCVWRSRKWVHRLFKLLPDCRGWQCRLQILFLPVGICCHCCNHCEWCCCGTHQDPCLFHLLVCRHCNYLPRGGPLGMGGRWILVQLGRGCRKPYYF